MPSRSAKREKESAFCRLATALTQHQRAKPRVVGCQKQPTTNPTAATAVSGHASQAAEKFLLEQFSEGHGFSRAIKTRASEHRSAEGRSYSKAWEGE